MKKIFALMTAPVVLLLAMDFATPDESPSTSLEAVPAEMPSSKLAAADKPAADKAWYAASGHASADALVGYALSLQGSPYVFGGTSASGFDCSGFTSHVFEEFDVPITRSSATQAHDSIPVAREEARPGDLVIFTGTNPAVREPGHVGIVISQPGDTISFVHSSSNGGVKISQVEGSGYDTRFLGIRRLL